MYFLFFAYKGHKIQASIPCSLLSVFDDQIVEGRVYRMSCFTVKHNLGVLVASYHRFIFIFNENTKVEHSDSCIIPSYGFSLIAAENVLLKKFNYGYMVGEFIYVFHPGLRSDLFFHYVAVHVSCAVVDWFVFWYCRCRGSCDKGEARQKLLSRR
jgi:hypothetical protein